MIPECCETCECTQPRSTGREGVSVELHRPEKEKVDAMNALCSLEVVCRVPQRRHELRYEVF